MLSMPAGAPPFAAPQGYGETDADAEFDEAMAEEEEEPRRGRRGLMIVAALVGAIGLGGGMAYGYKTFFPSRSGPAPVIKDTQGPIKSKPRLPTARASRTPTRSCSTGSATRPARRAPLRRWTHPRPTTIQRAAQGEEHSHPDRQRSAADAGDGGFRFARSRRSPPLVVVPGVSLEGMGRRRVAASSSRRRPRLHASSFRRPRNRPGWRSSPRSGSHRPPTCRRRRLWNPPLREEGARRRQGGTGQAARAEEGSFRCTGRDGVVGAGSWPCCPRRRRAWTALKIFANMQEKYGEVLSSRTPDVQEATSARRACGIGSSSARRLARCGRRPVHSTQDRRLCGLLGDVY